MSLSEQDIRLNLLVAYPYMSKKVVDILTQNKNKLRFVLDSGAFTAWKAGKPIALDDYCKFLDTLPFTPWRYFTLDVIGDPEGSMRNYKIMLQRGYKPVPIFTRGEDPSALDEYYKTSDLVGIGGLVGTQKNKGFVNGIMNHVKGRKVHWLGFTSMDYVKHYKPYMCDSSGWESGARYATLRLYMGCGQFETIKKQDFQYQPNKKILDRISNLKIDPYLLKEEKNWVGGPSVSRNLCAASGVALSVDLQKSLGVKMFNAAAAYEGIEMLITHYCKQEKT
jgi:hypothetical protein